MVVGDRVEDLLERSQFDAVVFVGVPVLWVIRTWAVIVCWFPLVCLSAVGKIHLGLGPEVIDHRHKIILHGIGWRVGRRGWGHLSSNSSSSTAISLSIGGISLISYT